MKYFAYGSNMSLSRLRQRVPSATSLGTYSLSDHELRFHKISKNDGSAKCDVYHSGDNSHFVMGVLYEIDVADKQRLDRVEGLNFGYDEKEVSISNDSGDIERAVTYYATNIDDSLLPFTWYKTHVLVGAREASLPEEYINTIEVLRDIRDHDREREAKELAIYE